MDNLRDRFAEVDSLKAENEKLQADNEKLTNELRSTDYARNRAAELDRLLKVAPNYTITPARVIGIGGAQSFDHTVTIDAGTADGVRPDMTVLNGDGLVGRVVPDDEGTATVLLIGDRNSTVGGRLNSTLALGFVSGRGDVTGSLDYKLVDLRARPKVGDRIVTWGSSGNAPYVPGVPIGDGHHRHAERGHARVDRGGEAVRRPDPDRHGRRGDRSAGPAAAHHGLAAEGRLR